MMKDERIYAFVVAHTSRSRARIRRISIHRRWLRASACAATLVLCAALYGFYGLVQQTAGLRIERENNRLRRENERQRQKLDELKTRIDAIETDARRLSEQSGLPADEGTSTHGAGGPHVAADEATVTAVEVRAAQLEGQLRAYEDALRRKLELERIPSIWPVGGEITDDFGVRRNPFGGGSAEFHDGLDIATAWGTPVIATGNGTVSFAGSQNGYGQIVVVDHGDGLSTAYGHLSKIDVEQGREIKRGDTLGRVGSTGRSTGPHLHYEVRVGEAAVSPARYLPIQ
jgi:murein DD-endopeptidase MepM/ murein hydrolase activator NlpD